MKDCTVFCSIRRMDARLEKCQSIVVAVFPILGEPTASTEPTDGTLDHPAHGFDHEAFGMIGPFDDFDRQVWHGTGDAAAGRLAR